MSQCGTAPNAHALDWRFVVEHLPGNHRSLIGTSERHNQIQLRTGIDNPAHAAKNSIHFPKCSKSIDVNRLQTGGLRQQFLVGHFETPANFFLPLVCPSCVQKWTLRKENLATRALENYSLGSCSCLGTKQFARLSEYSASFFARCL